MTGGPFRDVGRHQTSSPVAEFAHRFRKTAVSYNGASRLTLSLPTISPKESRVVLFLPERSASRLINSYPSSIVGPRRRNRTSAAQSDVGIPSFGLESLLPENTADDPIGLRSREGAARMLGVAAFGGVVNVLMLWGSRHMLQVYDWVIRAATSRPSSASR